MENSAELARRLELRRVIKLLSRLQDVMLALTVREELISIGELITTEGASIGPVPEGSPEMLVIPAEVYDASSGALLDNRLVAVARKEELDWVARQKHMIGFHWKCVVRKPARSRLH